MTRLKILFTCVGRRIELMQAFRSASEKLGISIEIWGGDSSESAPALFYCDKRVKLCRIGDPGYIGLIADICEKNGIDAVIPTIDTDLIKLSQSKALFEKFGTRVIISDEDKIKICRDKRRTAEYFKSVGLFCPETFDDVEKYPDKYPAFIKPKDGSSSIFAYKAETPGELKAYAGQVPEYIIQPFIDGREYTVDIFCDFNGNPIYITPRIRLATRSGEVLKTEITADETIIEEVKKLLSDYRPCGAVTIQLIREKATGVDYYIEINPRYGGGAPLSIKAGADSPKALLELLCGRELSYIHGAACPGLVFSRFDQSICINNGFNEIEAVIFDLDDTLYNEIDYVKSGFRAAAKVMSGVENAYEKLYAAFSEKKSAIDEVLKNEGITDEETKNKCVRAYREQIPDIALSPEVSELLEKLKKDNIKIGIITDGRPEGQRNKIKALGLEKYADEIIITDEIGGVMFRKPNDISFRIMQRRLNVPFNRMIYVGDNTGKDFIAPKQLGMNVLHYKNPAGIYYTSESSCYDFVEKLEDVYDYIKKR